MLWRMARRKISNEIWAALELLIPVFSLSPKGSRRRCVDGRAALSGILYVLYNGIPWEELPQELGFGSGMTCWRRLCEYDQIDWKRASVDAASVT